MLERLKDRDGKDFVTGVDYFLTASSINKINACIDVVNDLVEQLHRLTDAQIVDGGRILAVQDTVKVHEKEIDELQMKVESEKCDYEDEIWKDIKGYENQYQISNLGNIRALSRKGKRKGVERMKTTISNWGYPIISIWKNNKPKTFSVHRLVAETFIDNPNNKAEVNHKNGIKTDNRVENLEWVTREENIQHAYDTGLNPRSLPLSKIVLKKKVLCLETGDVFNSLTQAAENYKIPISHLSSCLNKTKHRKTVGGFHWIYCRCQPVSEEEFKDVIYKRE